tara:strand:+ start:9737 stop:9955 length:219 start_codon:yes stop_codon:yes gene_type:complete
MPANNASLNNTAFDGRAPVRELNNISTLGTNVLIGQSAGNKNAVQTAGNSIQNSFIGYESGKNNLIASNNVF